MQTKPKYMFGHVELFFGTGIMLYYNTYKGGLYHEPSISAE